MSWYKGGEKVKLFPVEWVVKDEGFLTNIETTYRTEDGRKFKFHGAVPRRAEGDEHSQCLVREELAEQLSHIEVTFPD